MTTKSNPAKETVEAASERARSLADVGIDTYERNVTTLADFQSRIAGAVEVEPLSTFTAAQADLTRELGAAQVTAARTLLRT